jgi:hypothetical protein
MKKIAMRASLWAAAALAIAAGAPSGQADILAFGSYQGVIGVTAAEQPVPLRPNGNTTITFETTEARTLVAVTYNATCYVQVYSDFGGLGKVRIRITIDGIETNPQTGGQESALCSEQSPGQGMGAHSRQAAMVVRGAGTHTVRVSAIYTDSAYNGALYSSSILIQN